MKEQFENVMVDVITIKSEDVIATSGASESQQWRGPNETEMGA